MKRNNLKRFRILVVTIILFIFYFPAAISQQWSADGNAYYQIEKKEIVQYNLPENKPTVLVNKTQLTPKGSPDPLAIRHFSISTDQQKFLLFTNTKKVWRLETRGDYWVLDLKKGTLMQLGNSLPPSSLMFAKFSPDGNAVAFVSNNNIYVENLADGKIKPLTKDGNTTLINGTFDWAYEEEFACRDGFRWSPDSKSIAYWQIDAGAIKKFTMVNYTDGIYSKLIPLEYPKVGEDPSFSKVGVVSIRDGKTKWIQVPGIANQNYIVRMEFIPFTNRLLLQQLNRKQNHSKLFIANALNGSCNLINEETDPAWVDVFQTGNTYAIDYTNKFFWMRQNKSILWVSEKDGWRHLYEIMLDEKKETLITKGNYDIIDFKFIDEKNGYVYYMASPDNATQNYLYRTKINGSGKPELMNASGLKGTHDYNFSSNGKYAKHTFSNHYTRNSSEWIYTESQKPLKEDANILTGIKQRQEKTNTEFFKITTKNGIEMDGWMAKPKNFDSTKKYPVVFYVYTEPAGANVKDAYGTERNFLYNGDMLADGYLYISIDNRGTPVPKGREWRKSIYRKIGKVNIEDQAMGAMEILKWNFVDPDRVAVWGWSGGGSATLNLLFQYPEIYKTGIAIAAVGNQLTYDNIYQERFMGLPKENMEDFVNGSPYTYAKNLKGNLLYIHGTGDDNVHYQNAEIIVNELIKWNKQFQFMPYPNRTHSISEGEGTFLHLSTLYTNYLKQYCPPGGR